MNQQQWLNLAWKVLREEFLPKAPEKVLLSYGFPKNSRGRSKAIGQCWHSAIKQKGGKLSVIFIHPCQWTNASKVLHVLLHEMIHSMLPKEEKHRGRFPSKAKEVGLLPPWTATTPSAELELRLNAISTSLGEFPKAAFDPTTIQRQGSRLRKWECPCGVIARVASDDFLARCLECGEDFERSG